MYTETNVDLATKSFFTLLIVSKVRIDSDSSQASHFSVRLHNKAWEARAPGTGAIRWPFTPHEFFNI